MCRNIRILYDFSPPTSDDEVQAAALQFVRKVSGMTKPSKANEEAFARAIDDVAAVTTRLLGELVTAAPPRDRELEAEKRRARSAARFGTGRVTLVVFETHSTSEDNENGVAPAGSAAHCLLAAASRPRSSARAVGTKGSTRSTRRI